MDTSSEPHPLRIFLVENHPDTRKYLMLYLEQMGHTVTSTMSMTEALRILPSAEWDVLISDIGLPDGDGWELLERSRLADSVYAIAMSGFGLGADRAKSKAAGYRHHMLKPFDPAALDAMLEEAGAEVSHSGRAA